LVRLLHHRNALFLFAAICVTAQTSTDRYPVVKDGKVGFIDSQGNEVIAPQFSSAGDMAHFDDGLAPVASADGAGYIDTSGHFVIGPISEWGQPRPFHEGIAVVLVWGKNGAQNTPALIDRTGHIVYSGVGTSELAYFAEGLSPFGDAKGWGFADKSFRWVIPPKYQWVERFADGLAPVQARGKWGYIDKAGNEIVRPKYDWVCSFSDGLGRVRIDIPAAGERATVAEMYGYVDRNGSEVIRPQFGFATDFREGRAFAIPPGSQHPGIIDQQGNFLHEPAYDEAHEFHEGLAAVRVGTLWGYVDLDGEWTITPRFEHADDFWHGLARAAWKDRYGYIDRAGMPVWKLATPRN